MRSDLELPASLLAGFLMVMVRMGGIMTFLPIPGLKSGPSAARAVFSVSSAFLLFPVWAKSGKPLSAYDHFFSGIVAEAMLGIAVGLAVSYLFEIVGMAAQNLSLQAGYSYATTIDPTTDADSGLLAIAAQLLSGLLFFGLGFDRRVLAILGRSFETSPPGFIGFPTSVTDTLAQAAGTIFTTGLHLSLPVIALLAMADIALALIGRLDSHLQVTTMSFPIKMVAGLALFAWIATLIPAVLQRCAQPLFRLIEQIVLGAGR